MEFTLTDTNRFYLEGTNKRFVHMATIHYNLREYMCFVDKWHNNVYIEQITGGSLERIEDDSLAESLTNFLMEQGILNVSKPTLSDDEWLKRKT